MTRDEAIAKAKVAMNHPGKIIWCSNQAEASAAIAKIERDAEHFVDASAALGLLKLEERKDNFQILCRVLTGWSNADEGANGFMNRLETAGLKIVEK